MTKPTVTEREAVEREWKAYCEGAVDVEVRHRGALHCTYTVDLALVQAEAVKRYPLPKVQRPRVVRAPSTANFEFRFMDGNIQERDINGGEWRRADGWPITPNLVAVWADLLANPTEVVDGGDGHQ